MRKRSAATLAALVLFGPAIAAVEAQQKFRLGGGAGFAVLYNPEIEHGRTAVVGGSLGFRFNDNLSVESGFSFARSHRQFSELGVPIDEQQGGIPAFEFESNRYHLDGSFVVHFGRRVPFHPYILAGGGLVRRDEMQTDFTYTLGENGEVLDRTEEEVLDTTEYEPTAHVGAGFDLYFLYNVAAKVEFRWWLPSTTDKSTRMFFFGASYFF
jgi:Outer membrane protein beta-barrel domain